MNTRRTFLAIAAVVLTMGVTALKATSVQASEDTNMSSQPEASEPIIRPSTMAMCFPGGTSWLAWTSSSLPYCEQSGAYDCQRTCANGSWYFQHMDYYRCSCYCCPTPY